MVDLSLCVLSRNEEKNIKKVVDNLTGVFNKNNVTFEIIAVSNNSTDNTLAVLENIKKNNKNLKIVNTLEKIGYGYAVRRGLQACSGKFIGYIDGDNQVSAEDVFKVYKKISSDDSISLCKSKRMSREVLMRKIISKFYNILFKLLFNIGLKDVNNCPKIMKIEDYKSIKLIQNDWFIDAEIILKLNAKNKKIFEVPVAYKDREEGVSNVTWKTIIEFLKNMFKYRINKSKYIFS